MQPDSEIVGRKAKPIIYGFDTETDNNGVDEAWIVQWALVRAKDRKVWTGRDIESVCVKMNELLQTNKPHIWYIHNATYDCEFLRRAFHDADQAGYDLTIIRRMGSVVIIRITNPDTKGYIEIRDSAKKIPGNLKNLGKSIDLPKLIPPGGEDFIQGWSRTIDYDDPETWKYVIRDAEIVAVAMQRLHDTGSTRATASGDSFHALKMWIVGEGNDPKDSWNWQRYFPHIPYELDGRLRKSYMGGLNISPYENRGHYIGEITHGDVHNMYGAVMSDDPLPYGLPTLTYEKPSDKALYIAEVRIRFVLKEGELPYFAFKNANDYMTEGLSAGEPVEECREFHEMSLTNIDLQLLQRFYDVEFDPDYPTCYWVFKQKAGVFKDYIDHWTEIKESSPKGSVEYLNAKNHINMVYGRFALAFTDEVTTIEWDDELGDYVFRTSQEVNEDVENYLPLAVFVTAHARRRLLEHVDAVGWDVIHCDTDSVIHKGPQSDKVVYGDHRGTWGHETYPIEIYEGGFKRYIEILRQPVQSLDDIAVTCAGVPQRKHIEHPDVPIGMWVELLDDPSRILQRIELGEPDYRIGSDWLRKLYIDNGMDPDHVNTLKLMPRKVSGGVILEGRTHTLSDNLSFRIRKLK